MRNDLKTSDVFSERNAFRKIREEQAKKATTTETNALKHKLNTYSKIKPKDDICLD